MNTLSVTSNQFHQMYFSTDKIIFSYKHFLNLSAELSHLQVILTDMCDNEVGLLLVWYCDVHMCDNEVGLLLVWYCNVHMCIKHQHPVDINIYNNIYCVHSVMQHVFIF